MTPGGLLQWRATWLGHDLCRDPRRCSGCGSHVATQGHQAHCPLGFRARFTLTGSGMRGTARRGPEMGVDR